MAIKIDWQPLPPRSGEEVTSYFPRLKENGTIDFETLCRLATKHSSVFHRGELLAAFDVLQREMSRQLALGKTVRIPEFGTFRLTIEANGKVEAARRRSKSAVRLKGVAFAPEGKFVESLGQPDFRWSPTGSHHLVCDVDQLRANLSDYLAAHHSITCAEFAALFHLGRSTANKYIRQLLDEGLLVRTGAGKLACYSLHAKETLPR